MKKLIFSFAAMLGFAASASAAFVTVNSNVTTSTRWTRDNVYILTRMIFVEPGATLTIEPGTIVRGVVRGAEGSDITNEPGGLVVARDAKIVANGTPDDPIVFTSIDDSNVIGGAATIPASYVNSQGNTKTVTPLNYAPDGISGSGTSGIISANGFAYSARWGGLVVLGNGYVANYNTGTAPTADANLDGLPDEPHTLITGSNTQVGGFGRDIIEGLDVGTIPSAGQLGVYGNKEDDDNSGVLRFVSVRYSGFKLGANNELNSITFGGVGSSTVLEFCEVAFGLDDGFEFFGGKLNTRHLYSLYTLDDNFDADEGFRGDQQFWAIVQGNVASPRSGYDENNTVTGTTFSDTQFDNLVEIDGAETNNNAALPYTSVNIYNFTIVSGSSVNSEFTIVLDARVTLNNVVAENTADIAAVSNTSLDPIGTIADVGNFHYYFDGNAGTTENRDFTDLVVPLTTSATEETTRQLESGFFYTKNGTDLRLKSGAAARTEDGVMPPSGLVQVNYAGYMRDNNFLNGWSVAEWLETLPTTNVARPAVSLSVSGNNPVVSFASAGSTIKYVIEKSTDLRSWTPVNGGTPVTGAGTINHTDTTTTFTANTPVYYRAYAL